MGDRQGIDEKTALAIQFFRSAMDLNSYVDEDGTLETAKILADKFTEKYGLSASVIRRFNRYFWVTDYYFDTYKYKGKIYYKTEVKEET